MSEQYIPKFTAQLEVEIPAVQKQPTFDDFKNELRSYAAECFKAHGKEFDSSIDAFWLGDVTFYLNFTAKGRYGYMSNIAAKHNTVLELQARSNKTALTADGFISSFKTRHTRIDLSKPVADIKAKIAAFIGNWPKLQALIDGASVIEAKRQADKEACEGKKTEIFNEVAKITGYKHSYGTFDGLRQTPYSSLKATPAHVIAETQLTIEQFAKFHAFLSELKGN